MIVYTMLVSKEPRSILADSIVANKDGGNIKGNGNLLFFGSDFLELLYTLT